MKKLCIFVVIGFIAGTVSGGGFDKASVPADVQWIAHIDVEAYRGTDISGALSSIRPEKHKQGLVFLKEQLGIDPMKDISSVTLYSSDHKGKDAVAVVKGSLDAELIGKVLDKNGSYEEVSRGDYILHKWKDQRRGAPCVASFISRDTVVLAGSVAEVIESAEVHEGESESLADAGAEGLKVPALYAGGFIVASAKGGAEGLGENSQAKVFRNARAVTLAVGEVDGQVKAELNVIAQGRESASQIQSVFMGLRAAVLLSEGKKPRLAKLAKKLSITVDGDKVRALLVSTPEELRGLSSGR